MQARYAEWDGHPKRAGSVLPQVAEIRWQDSEQRTMTGMSETATEHVNGSAPPPAAEDCADCATSGEKILAGVAFLFGAFILIIAIDMFTGGKIGGYVRERAG